MNTLILLFVVSVSLSVITILLVRNQIHSKINQRNISISNSTYLSKGNPMKLLTVVLVALFLINLKANAKNDCQADKKLLEIERELIKKEFQSLNEVSNKDKIELTSLTQEIGQQVSNLMKDQMKTIEKQKSEFKSTIEDSQGDTVENIRMIHQDQLEELLAGKLERNEALMARLQKESHLKLYIEINNNFTPILKVKKRNTTNKKISNVIKYDLTKNVIQSYSIEGKFIRKSKKRLVALNQALISQNFCKQYAMGDFKNLVNAKTFLE